MGFFSWCWCIHTRCDASNHSQLGSGSTSSKTKMSPRPCMIRKNGDHWSGYRGSGGSLLKHNSCSNSRGVTSDGGFRFGTSSDDSDQYSNASYFWLAALDAGKRTGFGALFWWYRAIDYGKCGTWCCSRNLDW